MTLKVGIIPMETTTCFRKADPKIFFSFPVNFSMMKGVLLYSMLNTVLTSYYKLKSKQHNPFSRQASKFYCDFVAEIQS